MRKISLVTLSLAFLLSACATDEGTASGETEKKETTVSTGGECGKTGSRLGRCF